MAFPSALLVITLTLLISATMPSSQALRVNNLPIGSIRTGGTIVCADASIATARTYRPIPRAPIQLLCGSGSTDVVLGQVVTNLSGVYFFVLTVADTLLIDPNRCYLRVTIPPNTCTLSIPNGFLRIPLVVLDVVQATLGNVLLFGQGPYSYVPY
ncbi:uncharacterized protein LOC132281780 [Cornus florida]|uniref:uncharacterized protein LOC132281780 n=1 Tax=Cornus florida TaxID=4283 RepID=UPI00289E44C3|nr:uncharacterized protein LOC132281780 [Cornus florida]